MREENKKFWNLLWVVLAVGVFYITSNLLMMAFYELLPRYIIPVRQEQAGTYLLIVDTVISAVLLALGFLAYRFLGAKKEGGKAPLSGKMLGRCATMGAAVFGVNTALDMILKPSAGGGGQESLISMLAFGVLFAPLIEEFFFRGVVYNLLDRTKSGWFSVIVSAVVFGVYHMELYQAIYTTLLGLVLALVYQRTGRMAYPIAIHMANNACACLAACGIPESAKMVLTVVTMVMILPAVWFLLKPQSQCVAAPKVLPEDCQKEEERG